MLAARLEQGLHHTAQPLQQTPTSFTKYPECWFFFAPKHYELHHMTSLKFHLNRTTDLCFPALLKNSLACSLTGRIHQVWPHIEPWHKEMSLSFFSGWISHTMESKQPYWSSSLAVSNCAHSKKRLYRSKRAVLPFTSAAASCPMPEPTSISQYWSCTS